MDESPSFPCTWLEFPSTPRQKEKKIKHFGNLREAFCFLSLSPNLCIITQGPAVQRTDNAIQQINPYPADKC